MAASKFSNFKAIGPLLRVIIVVLAVIAIILSAVANPTLNTTDYFGDGEGPGIMVMLTTSAAYSAIWCITAFIVLFFNGPYHPGIDIGFDIIGWLWAWVCAGLSLAFWIMWLSETDFYCNWNDPYHPDDYKEDCKIAKRMDGLMYSAAAFLIINGTLHLVLWIMSAKATHQRRMKNKREPFHELDDVKA